MVKTHVEESLGANPGDAALDPAPAFLGTARGRAFGALAHRPYRLLFTAFLVNQTGFWISHISLQGLMTELSGSSPRWLGFLFFAIFIPAFALAPLAGIAADRFDRKRIMITSYSAVAILSAALALLTGSDAITPVRLLALGFGLGTCFAFAGPASFALAVNAVPAVDMPSAVSLQAAANNLTRVVGPLVAAPLLITSRFEYAFGAFVVASGFAAMLTAMMHVKPHELDDEVGGIFARLAIGVLHARERRPALPALLSTAVLSLFGASHTALLPVFAEVQLGDADTFAWMIVASGLGAMLGALSIGVRTRQPTMHSAAGLMLAYGLSLVVFATSATLWVALALQFVIGWTYFAVMTGLQTLVQQIVDESKRGRVMSLFQVAWAGLVPWGGLLIGLTADAIGVGSAIATAAGVCAAYGAGVWVWTSREAGARRPSGVETTP